MHKFFLLTFAITVLSITSIAQSANSPPATYIMQLSSNLNCVTLDIELVSKTQDTPQLIRFGKGAYAATELPPVVYTFGDVTCVKKGGTQTFEILKNMIAPFQLTTGQAYFGGRIIFEESTDVEANRAPKVLSNCTRFISKARGDTGNECRDGVGVDTSAQGSKKLNIFIPDVTDEELKTVRTALSASEDQLLYLPLQKY